MGDDKKIDPGLSEKRKADNELAFRNANKEMRKAAGRFFDDAERKTSPVDFICECAAANCTDTIPMTIEEIQTVRRNKRQFIIKTGHEDLAVEKVTSQDQGYSVVEKASALV